MWPSTPATLQYSLTMAPSCRSLRRDTTARVRASSRAFAATKERSTTTRLTTWTAGWPRRYRHDRRSRVHREHVVAHVQRVRRAERLGFKWETLPSGSQRLAINTNELRAARSAMRRG